MNKKYLPSALILYLNYFIHGVGCSILGQAVIKEALAAAWGVEAMAITAISAALGLGRLIALPFAGPLSDAAFPLQSEVLPMQFTLSALRLHFMQEHTAVTPSLTYAPSSAVSQTPSWIPVFTRQYPRLFTKLLALLPWESNSSSQSLRCCFHLFLV